MEYNNNYKGNRSNSGENRNRISNASSYDFFSDRSIPPFELNWIKEKPNEAMIRFCEEAGRYLAGKSEQEKLWEKDILTSSKIRNIYGEVKRIQMKGYEEEKVAFMLLKPKVAYAQGRDGNNKSLKVFKTIFDKACEQVGNPAQFKNFCDFFEAILAYHRSFGGK